MNMREVPSYYDSHVNSTIREIRNGSILFGKGPTYLPTKNPVTIHCKAGSMSVRLVFETRGKCQEFFARYKDDGIPYKIDFCSVKTTITCRQSRSIEDREIGKQFARCWQINSKFSSLMEMTKVHLSSQRLTPAHKSSAFKIEETGLENLCSNLPPLEVDN